MQDNEAKIPDRDNDFGTKFQIEERAIQNQLVNYVTICIV